MTLSAASTMPLCLWSGEDSGVWMAPCPCALPSEQALGCTGTPQLRCTPRDTHGGWVSISQGPIWQTLPQKAVASAHGMKAEPSLPSTEHQGKERKLRGRRVIVDILLRVERQCLILRIGSLTE